MPDSGELRFDGRVAVVTGAGAGLGRAHALLLGSRGANVVVNDFGGSAEGVVDEIEKLGGHAVADSHSVSDPGAGDKIVALALDTYGRVDIVVNNAGIVVDQAFHKMSDEVFDRVLGVHLFGSYHVTRAAWPHFRDQRYGRVVLTTSVAGLFGNFGQSNYASAKAGMVGLGRTLAIEGARYGIAVNVISPGAATAMTAALIPPEVAAQMTPERVAPMVAFLSHESCPCTGEIFFAAQGRFARDFIAETPGYTNSDATPEDIAAHLDEIMTETGYTVPQGVKMPPPAG